MTHDVLIPPPRTIMEVYKMLPEGTLAELINGILFMSPAPKVNHQRTVGKLFNQISVFTEQRELGETLIAPIDVYLDEESNAVQPDIVFVSSKNLFLVHDDGIHGAPDFIIEVLSPCNSKHDLEIKKALYEKFGVTEYWVVDPETKETFGYTYQNKKYNKLHSEKGRVSSGYFNKVFEF